MTDSENPDQRLRAAASDVKGLQRLLIPSLMPEFPGWDFAAFYRPCEEAGGDFFGFQDLGPMQYPRTGIAVADVSGHGAKAAVVMAMFRAWLDSLRLVERPGEMIANDINTLLLEIEGINMFVTAVMIGVNLEDGSLGFINCGHTTPRILRSDGSVESLDGGRALPLGIQADLLFGGPGEGQLQPGDRLILYTDGITEAPNPGGERFDDNGLDAALQHCPTSESAAETVARLTDAVDTFRNGRIQEDDQCIVVVRRLGTAHHRS